MKHKLVFEGSTEDKTYQWGKYNIASGEHYKYSKHKIDSMNRYNWNTYTVKETGTVTHYWDKFTAKTTPAYYTWSKKAIPAAYYYNWDKYKVVSAGDIVYEWPKYAIKYAWDKHKTKNVTKYEYKYTIQDTFTTYAIGTNDWYEIGTADVVSYSRYGVNAILGFGQKSKFDTSTGTQTVNADTFYKPNLTRDPFYFSNYAVGESLGGVSWGPGYGATMNYKHFVPYFDVPIQEYNPLVTKFTPKAPSYYKCNPTKDTFGDCLAVKFVKINETQCKVMAQGIDVYDITYTQTPVGTETVRGDYIETIYGTTDADYPVNDYIGDYWYVYRGKVAGDYIETVRSDNPNKYPSNTFSNGFYYGNKKETVIGSESKGEKVGTESSLNKKDFPENGIQNGYWYVYTGEQMESQYFIEAKYLKELKFSSRNETIYMSKIKPTLENRTSPFSRGFVMKESISVTASYPVYDTPFNQINDYIQQGYVYIMTFGDKDNYYGLTNKSVYTRNNTFTELSHYTISSIQANGVVYDADEYQGLMAINSSYFQESAGFSVFQKVDYINQVSSSNIDDYPQDGIKDGFWYTFSHTNDATTQSKGDFLGIVSSYLLDTYPQDGIFNGVWYEYKDYEIELSAGVKLEDIYTANPNLYPNDGALNGYWYILQETSTDQYRGSFIDFVTNPDINMFPKDGIQGSYWYVYIGEVNQDIYVLTDTEIIDGVKYKCDINPESDYVIGTASSAQISFKVNNENKDAQKYNGLLCRYYCRQGDEADWTLIGKFNIDKCDVKTATTAELSGFDNIVLFDTYIDDWIKKTKFPISLKDMFESLCLYCGCSFQNKGFINQDYMVQDNFTSINITGRQILQYIAQASAGFAVANPDGTIVLRSYSESGSAIDNTKYIKAKQATFNVAPIDKLVIQMTEKDIGVSVGTGANVYKITNNPLFFAEKPEDIEKPAQDIFNIIKQAVYAPGEIELLQDFNINCGDIITVDGKRTYVMSKTIEPKGVKLGCVGNQKRKATGEETNSDIVALRGKYNELRRDLTTTQSTIGDVKTDLESQITQTANEINATVSYQGEVITQIKQNVDGINLSYNAADGTASITIGGITVNELTDKGYVDKTVAGIELTGYVKFNDLKNEGSTVINGKNIITGTITADSLNLTGAINWGDFSSSAKNTIIEYASDAGAAAAGVPAYIQNTYIDATTIYSPKIYGAEIYAGTTTDGYIKLASTGMNFCSKKGGPLIGMGYYASNYTLPYIVFGSGIDEYGTNRGLIKKYGSGIWIGDSDNINASLPGGTGIFIDFNENKIYKYINGAKTVL